MDKIVEFTCKKCGCQQSKVELKHYDQGDYKEGFCVKCGGLTIFECVAVNHDFVPSVPQRTPTVTCPYCSSTNCKKISGASKVGKVLMWGVLAAGSVGHTWHCNSCGSNFG